MSLQFAGWARCVHLHVHDVVPIRLEGFEIFSHPDEKKPLLWSKNEHESGVQGGVLGIGKLRAVSLSGDYVVKVQMNNNEIRSLLKGFIKSDPVTALELLSEVQIEATKSSTKILQQVRLRGIPKV